MTPKAPLPTPPSSGGSGEKPLLRLRPNTDRKRGTRRNRPTAPAQTQDTRGGNRVGRVGRNSPDKSPSPRQQRAKVPTAKQAAASAEFLRHLQTVVHSERLTRKLAVAVLTDMRRLLSLTAEQRREKERFLSDSEVRKLCVALGARLKQETGFAGENDVWTARLRAVVMSPQLSVDQALRLWAALRADAENPNPTAGWFPGLSAQAARRLAAEIHGRLTQSEMPLQPREAEMIVARMGRQPPSATRIYRAPRVAKHRPQVGNPTLDPRAPIRVVRGGPGSAAQQLAPSPERSSVLTQGGRPTSEPVAPFDLLLMTEVASDRIPMLSPELKGSSHPGSPSRPPLKPLSPRPHLFRDLNSEDERIFEGAVSD